MGCGLVGVALQQGKQKCGVVLRSHPKLWQHAIHCAVLCQAHLCCAMLTMQCHHATVLSFAVVVVCCGVRQVLCFSALGAVVGGGISINAQQTAAAQVGSTCAAFFSVNGIATLFKHAHLTRQLS